MLLKRRLAIATVSTALFRSKIASSQSDENRGPFGLTFGASIELVQQAGIHLSEISENKSWGTTFTATGLSQVLSDMDPPGISFGFKNKLWRIAVPSKSFGPDPYGSEVLTRYKELVLSLSQKYGHGTEVDLRDHEMWKKPNEYIMSLKQGRANRYTNFETNNISIEISIRAIDGENAYYLIIYESKSGMREFTKDKKEREQNAL